MGLLQKQFKKNIKDILGELGITSSKHKNNKTLKQTKLSKLTELDLIGDKRPLPEIIKDKEKQMKQAAKNLEFELAVILRDEIRELRKRK